MSEWDHFKLDGLIIKDQPDSFYFMVNVNVPARFFDDERLLSEKYRVIENCMTDEFKREIEADSLQYSITANYNIVHAITNENRLWEGSFQNRNNADHFIKENVTFTPNSFVGDALEYTKLDTVVQKLSWTGLNSKWKFSRLNSIIFVFSARCLNKTHLFRSNSLVLPASKYSDFEKKHSLQFRRSLENT